MKCPDVNPWQWIEDNTITYKSLATTLMMIAAISAGTSHSDALRSLKDSDVLAAIPQNQHTSHWPAQISGHQSTNGAPFLVKVSNKRSDSNLPGYRPPYDQDGRPVYRPSERRGQRDRYENYFRNANPDPSMCIRWREECRIGFWKSCESLRGDCSASAYCDALRFQCNVKGGAACFRLKDAC